MEHEFEMKIFDNVSGEIIPTLRLATLLHFVAFSLIVCEKYILWK